MQSLSSAMNTRTSLCFLLNCGACVGGWIFHYDPKHAGTSDDYVQSMHCALITDHKQTISLVRNLKRCLGVAPIASSMIGCDIPKQSLLYQRGMQPFGTSSAPSNWSWSADITRHTYALLSIHIYWCTWVSKYMHLALCRFAGDRSRCWSQLRHARSKLRWRPATKYQAPFPWRGSHCVPWNGWKLPESHTDKWHFHFQCKKCITLAYTSRLSTVNVVI